MRWTSLRVKDSIYRFKKPSSQVNHQLTGLKTPRKSKLLTLYQKRSRGIFLERIQTKSDRNRNLLEEA